MANYGTLTQAIFDFLSDDESTRGVLGIEVDDAYVIVDPNDRNRVMVRASTDGTVTILSALNMGVPLNPDYPVIVFPINRDFYVIPDPERLLAYVEETSLPINNVPWHTHEPEFGLMDLVSSIRLRPGLVYVKTGMTVTISPFFYVKSDGTLALYAGGDYDLTPGIPGTTGQSRWSALFLNRVTGLIERQDLTAGTATLTTAGLSALTLTDREPLMAFQLTNGMTTPQYQGMADIRVWIGTGISGVGVTKNNYAATTDPGVGDDSVDGYTVGSTWINVTLGRVFRATSVAVGAAVWRRLDVSTIRTQTDYDDTTAPEDGQAIVWDQALGKFKPGDVASGVEGGTGLNVTTEEFEMRKVLYELSLSSPGSFDVDNLDQTYDDLEIEVVVRGTAVAATEGTTVRLNGDSTTANYRYQNYFAQSTAMNPATGDGNGGFSVPGGSAPANYYAIQRFKIAKYASSGHQKVIEIESHRRDDATTGSIGGMMMHWENAAPVTRFQLIAGTNFAAGSYIRVTGVKKADVVTGATVQGALAQVTTETVMVWEKVAEEELLADAASVTVDLTPYTDGVHIRVMASLRRGSGSGNERALLYFNGDTNNANYNRAYIEGGGAGPSASGVGATGAAPWIGHPSRSGDAANSYAPTIIDIPYYNKTNRRKYALSESFVGTSPYRQSLGIEWTGTGPITSLRLQHETGDLDAGSAYEVWIARETTVVTGMETVAGGSFQAEQSTRLLLDYTAAVDLASGTAIAADTWTNLGPAHSITITNSQTLTQISVRMGAFIREANVGATPAYRILLDGTSPYMMGSRSATTPPAGAGIDAPVGSGGQPLILENLPVGTHTIQIQVISRGHTGTLYCRPATVLTTEFMIVQVVETLKTPAIQGGWQAGAISMVKETLSFEEELERHELSSAQASVVLTIPDGYDWYTLEIEAGSSAGLYYDYMQWAPNGDTNTANFKGQQSDSQGATGSHTSRNGTRNCAILPATSSNHRRARRTLQFSALKSTTEYKSVKNWGEGYGDATNVYNSLYNSVWMSTAAVTTITLTCSGNFVAGSKFILKGHKQKEVLVDLVGSGQGDLLVTKTELVTEEVIYETLLGVAGNLDIDLSAIPGALDYEDLKLVLQMRGTSVSDFRLFFNGDTTVTNYNTNRVYGRNGVVGLNELAYPALVDTPGSTSPAGSFSNTVIDLLGYRDTIRKKAYSYIMNCEYTASDQETILGSVLWNNLSAISRIQIQCGTGTPNVNTRVQIIGRKKRDVVTDVKGSIVSAVSDDDVSNPPTAAELDAIFGTPAVVGRGFIGLINDNGDDTTYWQVQSDGTSWVYVQMTKAI